MYCKYNLRRLPNWMNTIILSKMKKYEHFKFDKDLPIAILDTELLLNDEYIISKSVELLIVNLEFTVKLLIVTGFGKLTAELVKVKTSVVPLIPNPQVPGCLYQK